MKIYQNVKNQIESLKFENLTDDKNWKIDFQTDINKLRHGLVGGQVSPLYNIIFIKFKSFKAI